MLTIYVTKGLPASGKSTWALQMVSDCKGRVKRVNKDDLRAMIDGGVWSKNNERFIVHMRDTLIREALDHNCSVIVDDTNGLPKHLEDIQALAEHWVKYTGSLSNPKIRVQVVVQDFTHVTVQECIDRDLKRTRSVGEKVIRDMSKKYFSPPAPPTIEYNTNLPDCIICDIDGTVALMDGRSPYDYSKVHTDKPHQPVVDLLYRWCKGFDDFPTPKVLFVSGRKAECRDVTLSWLETHASPVEGIPVLYMREDGDNRDDRIVKKEIYEREIKDKYNVLFILDDRQRVVDMWRSLGLTCLQVAPGDF